MDQSEKHKTLSLPEFLYIRVKTRYSKVQFSEIIYAEALKNYVRIITQNQTYMLLLTMHHVEEVLPPQMFCRIHRSYIVSLKYVTDFDNNRVYFQNRSLPISEQYKKELMRKVIILKAE